MRPITAASVLDALSHHIGRENGISATDLVKEITNDMCCEAAAERLLRSCISELRSEGVAVASTPETGYYVAQTSDELEECCRFLRSRAMHSLLMEARLRKLALGELLGQIRVGT